MKEVDQAACKLMLSALGWPCPDLFSIFTKALPEGIECVVTEFANDSRLSRPVGEFRAELPCSKTETNGGMIQQEPSETQKGKMPVLHLGTNEQQYRPLTDSLRSISAAEDLRAGHEQVAGSGSKGHK